MDDTGASWVEEIITPARLEQVYNDIAASKWRVTKAALPSRLTVRLVPLSSRSLSSMVLKSTRRLQGKHNHALKDEYRYICFVSVHVSSFTFCLSLA